MSLPLASNQIPAWQIERASILHSACMCLQSAIHAGEKIGKSLRRVARRHNGRKYESDPTRQMKLSALTLRRAWNVWRRGGERPSAFRLNYRERVPTLTAPALVRFVDFCASQPQPSMKTAWQRFAARPGSFGRGRHAGKPLKFSYRLIPAYFPVADFYQMQEQMKISQAAQMKRAQLRFKVIVGIRSRLPDTLPPRRVKREINFEI